METATVTPSSNPFQQWREAAAAESQAARSALVGRRVKFTGFGGNTDGPTGTVSGLSRNAITVAWDSGTLPEICHQQAVTILQATAVTR